MESKTYGYIRVSTRDQNEERQVKAMEEFGVMAKCMIVDKQSGKDFDRPGYKRLMKKLRAGDILVIKSIDRLGRNYDEILEQWRILTKEKQVDVVVLDMPLLDTRKGRDLTGTLIADIVLQLLSYVAQTEREFIRQRQREGIEIAKANGVQFGRRPVPRPENYEEIKARWKAGELSCRAAAKLMGTSHTMLRAWLKADGDLGGEEICEN
ncbi:MAG: recombinase family protein [Clostridia bacterium]|nr:recombinase family protein [Clostridia bacterium]